MYCPTEFKFTRCWLEPFNSCRSCDHGRLETGLADGVVSRRIATVLSGVMPSPPLEASLVSNFWLFGSYQFSKHSLSFSVNERRGAGSSINVANWA